MKYLLMTYGALLILFSGGLMAKATVTAAGDVVLGLNTSPTSGSNPSGCLFCGDFGITVPPFGSGGSIDGVSSDFSFDAVTGQYSFDFGAGNGDACDGAPFPCVGFEADGSITGTLPKPIHMPLTMDTLETWSALGTVGGQWSFSCMDNPACPIFGGFSVPEVYHFSLDVFANPSPDLFGVLDATLSPAPEPGSFWLFATGLLPLLWICRRQLRPDNQVQ